MRREHEVLAASLEAVAENLDQLVVDAIADQCTLAEFIDRIDVYRHSLRRQAALIK